MGENAWQANFEIDVMSAARGVEAALPFLAAVRVAARVVFVSSTAALEYLGVPAALQRDEGGADRARARSRAGARAPTASA